MAPPSAGNSRQTRQTVSLITLLATSCLSILGGINEIFGFFTKVGFITVVVSLITGIVVLLYFPALIKITYRNKRFFYGLQAKTIGWVLGLLIILLGTIPFGWQYLNAWQYAKKGKEAIIEGSGVKSNMNWAKAADLYERMGLETKALQAKVFLAQSYYMIGDSKTAKTILASIDPSTDKDNQLQGLIYIVRSNIAKSQGDLPGAELDLQRAQELVEPGSIDQAAALLNYSLLLENKGPSYNKAVLENINKAKAIFIKQDYPKGVIISLLNLAAFYQYEPAIVKPYLDSANKLIQHGIYPDMEALIYADYGLLFKNQGNPTKALQFYQTALNKYASISDIAGQAEVENQIAYVQIAMSANANALQSVKQSKVYVQLLVKSEGIVNNLALAKIYRNQAGILNDLGETEEAEKQYNEALKVYDDSPDIMEEIQTRLAFASFYQNHTQNAKAQQILNTIEGLFVSDFNNIKHAYLVIAYNNLGKMYHDNGDLVKGKEYLDKSLRMAEDINDQFLIAQAMENQNIVNANLGNQDVAQLNAAKKIFHNFSNISEETIASLNGYLQNGGTMSKQQLADTTDYFIKQTDNPQMSVSAKNQVLLGLQVEDISNNSITLYQNKLRLLVQSLSPKNTPADYGRCNLSLALIEQRLGNMNNVLQYLKPADSLSSFITYPKCLLYLKKVGFLRFSLRNWDAGTDQLFKCIDISMNKPIAIASKEISDDLNIVGNCWNYITAEKRKSYVSKVQALKANSPNNELTIIYDHFLAGKGD